MSNAPHSRLFDPRFTTWSTPPSCKRGSTASSGFPVDHTFYDFSHAGLPTMSDVAVVPAIGQIKRSRRLPDLPSEQYPHRLPIRW